MEYGGAYPAEDIRELIENGFLSGVTLENVKPGSLDLSLTDELYRVNGAFLPNKRESVADAIQRAGGVRIDIRSVLERGSCYVCRLAESFAKKLPEDVYSYANPKSSSGRLDIHVRLIADREAAYDTIPRGYVGPLWVLVSPKTFPVIASERLSLNQIRFFNQDTRFDKRRLGTFFESDGGLLCDKEGRMIRYDEIIHSSGGGSVILTLDLDSDSPGYEALPSREPIDLSLEKYYSPEKFFRRVSVTDGSLVLNAHGFYILSTKEYVRVPAKFACEMAPMDARYGEFRSHYAGFIDPGWGIGQDDQGKGRQLTLEIRSFDSDFMVEDAQPIARIDYERMLRSPEMHYDKLAGSNYAGQSGPSLSKHFKPWTK